MTSGSKKQLTGGQRVYDLALLALQHYRLEHFSSRKFALAPTARRRRLLLTGLAHGVMTVLIYFLFQPAVWRIHRANAALQVYPQGQNS